MGIRFGAEPKVVTLRYPYEVYIASYNGERVGVYVEQTQAIEACRIAHGLKTDKAFAYHPALWDRAGDQWLYVLEGSPSPAVLCVEAERLRVPPELQTASDGRNGAPRRRLARVADAVLLSVLGLCLGAALILAIGLARLAVFAVFAR